MATLKIWKQQYGSSVLVLHYLDFFVIIVTLWQFILALG